MILIKEIETSLCSFDLYLLFKNECYSYFLDSSIEDYQRLGNFSFIGFAPFLIFRAKGNDV